MTSDKYVLTSATSFLPSGTRAPTWESRCTLSGKGKPRLNIQSFTSGKQTKLVVNLFKNSSLKSLETRKMLVYAKSYSRSRSYSESHHAFIILFIYCRFHKCDVYSYDYSGYGISSGHASEANLKADIRAVYDVRQKSQFLSLDADFLVSDF